MVPLRPERVPGRLTRGPLNDRCSDYVLRRRLDWHSGQGTIRSRGAAMGPCEHDGTLLVAAVVLP